MEARFFIDRAIGAELLPSALRDAEWDVVTMRERYGEQAGQFVSDITWIRSASEERECILTKDDRVATRPAEAQTIYMCDARVFAFARADLTAAAMIDILLDQSDQIDRWAARVPGPYVASLSSGRPIRRRRLNYP